MLLPLQQLLEVNVKHLELVDDNHRSPAESFTFKALQKQAKNKPTRWSSVAVTDKPKKGEPRSSMPSPASMPSLLDFRQQRRELRKRENSISDLSNLIQSIPTPPPLLSTRQPQPPGLRLPVRQESPLARPKLMKKAAKEITVCSPRPRSNFRAPTTLHDSPASRARPKGSFRLPYVPPQYPQKKLATWSPKAKSKLALRIPERQESVLSVSSVETNTTDPAVKASRRPLRLPVRQMSEQSVATFSSHSFGEHSLLFD